MMDKIWWEQVGCGRGYVQQISDYIRTGTSFILQLRDPLPWPESFEQCLLSATTPYRTQHQYRVEDAPEQEEPGAFLMEGHTSPNFRLAHWPDDPVGRYLCTDPALEIHESIFRIRGIHTREQLNRWSRFVREYERHAEQLPVKAMFWLEYDGPDAEEQLPVISFQIRSYNCHVFCLEASSLIRGEEWQKSYAAELALHISRGVPEICAALLSNGEKLISSPVSYSQQVLRRFQPTVPGDGIESAIWRAQITLCFPELERQRTKLVRTREKLLRAKMPQINQYGERISSPFSLEIGELCHMSGQAELFTAEERSYLSFLRTIRNELAHLTPLTLKSIQKLFSQIADD